MRTSHNKTKLAVFAAVPLLTLAIAIITSAFSHTAMAQQPSSSHPFAVGSVLVGWHRCARRLCSAIESQK
jgi:hypothetical protein